MSERKTCVDCGYREPCDELCPNAPLRSCGNVTRDMLCACGVSFFVCPQPDCQNMSPLEIFDACGEHKFEGER